MIVQHMKSKVRLPMRNWLVLDQVNERTDGIWMHHVDRWCRLDSAGLEKICPSETRIRCYKSVESRWIVGLISVTTISPRPLQLSNFCLKI